jgi:hypothetical protein
LPSPQLNSDDTSCRLLEVAREFKYSTMLAGTVDELHVVVTSAKGVFNSDDATMEMDAALYKIKAVETSSCRKTCHSGHDPDTCPCSTTKSKNTLWLTEVVWRFCS